MGTGFFGNDRTGYEFAIFSTAHWVALAITAAMFVLVFLLRRHLTDRRYRNAIRYGLLVLLAVCEVTLHIWHVSSGQWDIRYSLPFELCNMMLLLSIAMLASRSYRLYEFVYFAGIGGSLQALATPDLAFTFPHFRFIQFFVAHVAIVLACLFMTGAYGFRPTIRSIFRAMIGLNAVALPVFLFNLWSGANYMFLMRKPAGGSLLDYLGPWPWYIASMELVALAIFILLYLPFAVRRW